MGSPKVRVRVRVRVRVGSPKVRVKSLGATAFSGETP